ncbi:hypothetical protein J5N97_008753 [Dioscorea zingiberensis]|uniref:DYW domain-containing protein n=1 Tax=Dioscorea zingiberensis TaxID=325984 RepID=A0A9D5CY24_9LILI|nr:hypothetical protein J5N97_008753 [Dioscorea zingiberensis]
MLKFPVPSVQVPPSSPESQLALLHHCKTPRELHQLHAISIKSGLFFFPPISARFLTLYSHPDLGTLSDSLALFPHLPRSDSFSFNVLIKRYIADHQSHLALCLFRDMLSIPGVAPDGFTFPLVMKGCAQLDADQEEGGHPNIVTLVSVLSAVSGLALLQRGRLIHEYIQRNGFSLNGILGICLIEMYSKCGSIESAISVFEEIPRKKLGHWTAMVVGLGIHGMADFAFKLFAKMLRIGMKPNAITFVGVLNACSHAGIVDEGRRYFKLMRERYEIEPTLEHYGCFVDLLCRIGNLNEAMDVINQMPMRPNKVIWMSLLSGCRKHENNIKIAEFAAQNIMELDPGATGCYVLLSNIYAASGLWDNVSKLREKMKEQGVRKDPGCSSLELGGIVHEFIVGDRSHPQSDKIYIKLNEMSIRLRHAGYIPDTTQVLLCVDEKEKETELSHHSERLAMAFALINAEQRRPIRIVKNLRVCNDCHNVTKLLSHIYDCEIIVRDNSRFHHFRNGTCSCMDYW